MGNKGWTHDEDLDMENVSTEPPPPVPVDIYAFEVVKAEPEETKEKKPAVRLQLALKAVHGGPDGELPGGIPDRKMFDKVPVTKESAFRVKRLAAALGVDPPKRTSFEEIEAFCQAACGQRGYLRSKLDTYQGKTNHKVDDYFTADDAGKAHAALHGGATAGDAASGDAAPARRSRRAG